MIKKIIKYFLVFLLIVVILNIPVTTKQGINYETKIFRIPFYIKIVEYFDRNYQYKRLVDKITARQVTDEENAIAIFNWVIENIHKPPQGFDIVDDHTFNIIIRRYGAADQMADVFTTLCVYSGIPAFCSFDVVYDRKKRMAFSYVLLDNKWRVFDVYNNVFFVNSRGEIASVEDIIAEPSIVRGKGIDLEKETAYRDFFKNLKPIKKDFISKAEKQIPMLRIKYEIRRIFRRFRNRLTRKGAPCHTRFV